MSELVKCGCGSMQWHPCGGPLWHDELDTYNDYYVRAPGYCPYCGDRLLHGVAEQMDDSALLDALERMVLGSAEHGEEVELDARHEGHGVLLTSWDRWTCDFGSGEYTGPDLRAAIRAALDGEPADE
jgi:hypothetical protein